MKRKANKNVTKAQLKGYLKGAGLGGSIGDLLLEYFAKPLAKLYYKSIFGKEYGSGKKRGGMKTQAQKIREEIESLEMVLSKSRQTKQNLNIFIEKLSDAIMAEDSEEVKKEIRKHLVNAYNAYNRNTDDIEYFEKEIKDLKSMLSS